ncbi:MAG: hypothetical protein R3257_01790, partial [bacterium]|nr:hypothetical protein [bacterium]
NEGHVNRNKLVLGLQWINRVWGYGRIKGISYSLGHWAAAPMVMGLERLYMNAEQLTAIGTSLPRTPGGNPLWLALAYYGVWGLGASSQNIIDGLINTVDTSGSLRRTMKRFELSLREAILFDRPRFFNPDPESRPIQKSFPRLFLQRTVPLFAALEGVSWWIQQNSSWAVAGDNLKLAAGASLVSSLMLHQMQKSPRLAELGTDLGLVTDAGRQARKATYALNNWGTGATVLGEQFLVALMASVGRFYGIF